MTLKDDITEALKGDPCLAPLTPQVVDLIDALLTAYTGWEVMPGFPLIGGGYMKADGTIVRDE